MLVGATVASGIGVHVGGRSWLSGCSTGVDVHVGGKTLVDSSASATIGSGAAVGINVGSELPGLLHDTTKNNRKTMSLDFIRSPPAGPGYVCGGPARAFAAGR